MFPSRKKNEEEKRMMRNILGLMTIIVLYAICLWFLFFANPCKAYSPELWNQYKLTHLKGH